MISTQFLAWIGPMMRHALLFCLALALGMGAAHAQSRVQSLTQEELTYRQRLEERIAGLDRQMRSMTGLIERLQFDLRQQEQRISALETELEAVRAGAPIGGGQTSAAPETNGNVPGAPDQGGAAGGVLPSGEPQAEYDAAYGLLGRGKFAEGEAAFRQFLARHPNNKLAGNARYWIGESLYARQRYQDAATTFLDAWQQEQRGVKAPDNLLKLGLSLQQLDKKDEACASYGKLLSDYRGAAPRLLNAANRERRSLGCS